MPSISEILDSVSVPALIKDEIIRNGNFEKSSRGVIYYSGGFTVVFPVDANGQKWAFRCWHTEMGNVRERFKVISDYINQLNSSYFCNFYYCDSGLIVDGKIFPTTRMDWVNGMTINQYIIENASNKELMLSLADKFLVMTDSLHKHHIAHGDLQHGNIIVTDAGDIRLVDYDSLFVPGLDGMSDIIIGKAEYQHPKRKQIKISSEKLDYFSELVIYLSILAIAHKPSIIRDFSIEDSLLFQANDWNDFERSPIYTALKGIGNDDISLLIDVLTKYLNEDDINNLRPFADIWRSLQKEPIIHSFLCGNVDGIAFRGLETSISWQVENASKVFINTKEMPSGQSTHIMTFTKDAELTLIIKNGLHTVEQRKHIKVLNAPIIQFSIGKHKLKKTSKGTESTTLNWSVSNASSVELRCRDSTLSTSTLRTNYIINPQVDSKYELVVIGLDNKTIFKSENSVIVRELAKVSFNSDKLFTLPGIPVTISWDVKGAKNVRLNNSKVGIKGQTIFKPNKDEHYVLTYEDEFGTSSTELMIKMLPLPIIKSVLVDTPNINNAVGIQYSAPRFQEIPRLPSIETAFVSLNIPDIPDLNESGFNITLQETPKTKLSEKITRFIKTIFK
ncbi:MAG: hypothetical protein J6B03_04990 [Candidatus Homeothermus sp.]|nr:hypothetical protein [Candidatus Homeothermus sp.]